MITLWQTLLSARKRLDGRCVRMSVRVLKPVGLRKGKDILFSFIIQSSPRHKSHLVDFIIRGWQCSLNEPKSRPITRPQRIRILTGPD